MIFDKNFLTPNSDSSYFVYQEEQDKHFNNPYNDNPYIVSSLQKLKKSITCKKKKAFINHCLENYNGDLVEQPQLTNAFPPNDLQTSKSSLAEYAKSSYQKVLKDVENIQKLIDQFGINEVTL